MCADGARLEGAIIMWLPEKLHLRIWKHPWSRTYREAVTARWVQGGRHCQVGTGRPSLPGGYREAVTARWVQGGRHCQMGTGRPSLPGGYREAVTARWVQGGRHCQVGTGRPSLPGGSDRTHMHTYI